MKAKLLIMAALIFMAQTAAGVSLAPQIIEQLKASGQLESIVQADRAARAKGVWEANPDPYRWGVTTDIDTLHCLIVLVDFDDMTHESGFPATPDEFDSLLFSSEVFEPGSMTDYYFETSYGQALLMGEVTPWLRMPERYSYYVDGQRGFGNYPRNAQRLAEDAVMIADHYVDFTLYDNDGDLMVDGLFIVHAGPGYEDTGNLNYIHSHVWVTSYDVWLADSSVYVSRYSMEPEETGGGQLVHIGVFCHEFGHVLGLPDLYDYDYDSDGTGMWSIMSGGSWGGGGMRPVHFDGWSKCELGWVSPTVVEENLHEEQIDAIEYSPDIYKLYGNNGPPWEYFIVENRRLRLFDASLPGQGLVIFHVDDSVDNNDNQNHYHVAVEQADGNFDLEHNRGSDAGDPWPGYSNNRTFDDFSVPNSNLYFDIPSEISVTNISDDDSSMQADLFIEYNLPLYEIQDITIDDSAGNGNGYPEPGESCSLAFTAMNVRAYTEELVVTLSCSDPEILIEDSVSTFDGIPIDTPFGNEDDPFLFAVPADYQPGFVTMTLTFSANGGDYQQPVDQRLLIGYPEILLVDDDDGGALESYYLAALNELNLTYEKWDISSSGSPAAALNQHQIVIWFTGDTRPEPPAVDDVEALMSYLDNGGRLILTSQDFVQRLAERGQAVDLLLLHDYLEVDYAALESNHFVTGSPGTNFDGLQFLTAGSGGAQNQISQDALQAEAGAMTLMTYEPGTISAVGAAGNGYAAVTVGFGIEGIYDGYPGYDSRADFIAAARQFLYDQTGVPEIGDNLPEHFALSKNFPNPFNATTMIEYTLTASGPVKVEVFDILGRSLETLVDRNQPAGRYQVEWNAAKYASGVYFYKIQTADSNSIKKMVLLK